MEGVGQKYRFNQGYEVVVRCRVSRAMQSALEGKPNSGVDIVDQCRALGGDLLRNPSLLSR